MVYHMQLSRQERSAFKGRLVMQGGPLCDTGDGHYVGTANRETVTCRRCLRLLSYLPIQF